MVYIPYISVYGLHYRIAIKQNVYSSAIMYKDLKKSEKLVILKIE